MKLLLDNIIFSLQRSGGISVYWYELVKRVVADNLNCTFIDIPNVKSNSNVHRSSLLISKDKLNIENPDFIRLKRYLPIDINIYEPTLVHSSYYRYSKSKLAINVTTVHDFIYEKYSRGLAKQVHHYQKKIAIERSSGIICVSENTKNDLLNTFPKTDQSKIKVIYNGVSELFRPVNVSTPLLGNFCNLNNKKYLLFIGSRASYKNFDVAVKTLVHFSDFEFVIVSGGFLSKKEISFLNHLIPDRYHYFNGLSEEELNLIYNHAFCLIYSSSYEGFGIPIIEAMKAGCPVISTNKSSIPEIAGDAALLVDRISAEDFAEKIIELENQKVRNALINKGLIQTQKYSWDKCYTDVIQFYKEVFSSI
ncbi:MAG: glycosyltransferase family 4 protein [Bacteroidales bacterium]|nr:glycosyltransferase family 4 protein [Bacteroidales bacterium]